VMRVVEVPLKLIYDVIDQECDGCGIVGLSEDEAREIARECAVRRLAHYIDFHPRRCEDL